MTRRPLARWVLPLVLAVPAMALLWTSAMLWRAGYDDLAHALIVRAGKAHQEALFKARYLTPAAFTALRASVTAAAVAMTAVALASVRYADRAAAGIDRWRRTAAIWLDVNRSRFAQLRTTTKLALGVLLLLQTGVTLVRIVHTPVSYDEAWTHLNFTSRPIVTSLSYYPAPNNHILFSALTTLTRGLPWSPLTNMRLISLCCSLATTVALFWMGVRFFDERAVIVSLSLFAFSFPIALYGLQARGYALLMLCTAICFFALVTFALDPRSRSPLAAYAAASVLGFYTIPTFLYPFASMTALVVAYGLSTRQWRLVRLVIATGVVIAALVVTVYAPVFLMSGVGAVTSNADVQRLSFTVVASRLAAHLSATADWLCGVSRGGLAVVLAIAVAGSAALFRTTEPRKHLLVGSMLGVLMLPPGIAIAHGVIPYERTWIYVLVPLFVLAAAVVERGVTSTGFAGARLQWAIPVVVAIVAVASNGPFQTRYDRDYARDLEADRLFTDFPSEGIGSIASDDVYFADLLTYRVQLTRREPVVARRWTPGTPVDADVLVVSRDAAASIGTLAGYRRWRDSETVTVFLAVRQAPP